MRLTITAHPRRNALRIAADRAWDYPPDHLRRVLAAAADRAVEDLNRWRGSTEWIPAPRCAPDASAAGTAVDRPDVDWSGLQDEEVTRCGVLRLLELGHTVAEVADHLGVDPELIDRWDDDAATDGYTDLLAAGLTGLPPTARTEGWG